MSHGHQDVIARLHLRIDAAFAAFETAGYDLSEFEGDLSDLVADLAAERDKARADMQEEGRATQLAIEDAMHRGAQAAAQDAHDLSGW